MSTAAKPERKRLTLNAARQRMLDLDGRIAVTRSKVSDMFEEKKALEKLLQTECKHEKVIYIDGFKHWHDRDEHCDPQARVCLSCGLYESSTLAYTQSWQDPDPANNAEGWVYKTLTATPIRRYLTHRSWTGTEQHERSGLDFLKEEDRKKYEQRLCQYWYYASQLLFKLPYPVRVKKAAEMGLR